MKYTKIYLTILLAVGIAVTSCSDIQNEIAPPVTIGVHGKDVLVKSSSDFHGRQLVNDNMDDCKRCHASDFSGGTAKVNCNNNNCHPAINVHVDGMLIKGSEHFHGKFIAAANWKLDQCSQCHGANYAGGITSPTCNTCHSKSGGPEACNTCHGDFAAATSIAPPQALNDSTSATDAGVGAHVKHLSAASIAQNVSCEECHVVPAKFSSAGHIDNSPKAEIIFGSFSSSGIDVPTYNPGDNKCSNTYCHGSFKFSKANSSYSFAYTADEITGNNFQPVWNKVDDTQAACGTCHGLPPTGHVASELRSCATCHVGVINNKGEIIDKTKHMDGKINVFNN